MKKEQAVLLPLLAFGLLFLAYRFFSSEMGTVAPEVKSSAEIPAGAFVVTLSRDGYSPDTLSVKVGDTVAFRSVDGELFWPASNLHPSHALYPEFDPLEPVQPNAVWSFTFTKTGEWKYHDHLAPYFTGVITVTE